MDKVISAARHGDLTRGPLGNANARAVCARERLPKCRGDARQRPAPLRARRAEIALRTASPEVEVATAAGELRLLEEGEYYDFLGAQGDKLVVVDFYTDWCGPCKLIYPDLVELDGAYEDVRIVKFRMTKENKALGKELGIRVAPTFFLYKGGRKVAQMTGAKVDKLKELIEEHRN